MYFWDGQQWADEPARSPSQPSRARSRAAHIGQAILEGSLIAALTVGLVAGSTFAAKGGHGSTSGACTTNAPTIDVQNNWAWGSPGSWGMPGQKLGYYVRVTNNDVGCSSTTFVISVSAPDSFSVVVPTRTVKLAATSAGYLWAYVTSPASAADGNYPLVARVQRSDAPDPEDSYKSYYKVYSADAAAPSLFWSNPWDGQTITSRSFNMTVSSSDDHAVKKIELYLDGAAVATKACNDITYICQLNYSWRRKAGSHTARFVATDWMGNKGTLSVSFTAN
jgi:hypothetical protein